MSRDARNTSPTASSHPAARAASQAEETAHGDGRLDAMTAARLAVAALIDGGMRHVVLCPGSRSAPLAYALAEAEANGRVEVSVRIDERDAGFLAVGLAVASGLPVGVVTTSGTGVGELLPAVMEADHAGLGVLALTADRPVELHGTGANQTTVQAGLFGTHVRHECTVAAGYDPSTAVAQALAAAAGGGDAVAGPVQLNLAFREPLVPADDAAIPSRQGPRFSSELSAWECLEADATAAEDGEADGEQAGQGNRATRWAAAASGRSRTLVIAGHGAGPLAAEFAESLELPLLAEPSSDARHGSSALAYGPYLLTALAPEVERVVLFGRPTLSRQVAAILADPDVDGAHYLPAPAPWFEAGRRRERAVASLDELAAFAGRGAEGWLPRLKEAAERVAEAVELVVADREEEGGLLTGPGLAAAVWNASPGPLVLGSSRPVRDLDLVATPRRGRGHRVYANRGLAGIDGTVATASGVALAERRRTVALMGDVTFLHDVGGLLIPRHETRPPLDVVVAHDDGGTIFETLEHGGVAERGPYARTVNRMFRTPHGVDLTRIAEAYGWSVARASDRVEVDRWLRAGASESGPRLLQARVQPADPRGLHRRMAAAAAEALRAL